MFRSGVGFSRTRAVSLAIVAVASIAVTTQSAEARRRHHASHRVVRAPYSPPYAAMVVDGNTGRTLYALNENALRHPASITKVMTLYLLFEQLEKGRYTLESPLRVSSNAANQEPSKLGVRPGETIEVEDAIKAIVTRSANDVAVVIAENIGGSSENFAAMMTKKARSLGMSRTLYRNPSGLPDPEQVTTAHDLIILGRAIQERYPAYYRYFSTSSFRYAGRVIGNHNRLLGRVDGVDGIKTGYTRASGFNLLTSARNGGRHLIAAVLGGTSAASRDRQMVALLDEHMDEATAGRRTVAAITESGDEDAEPARVDPVRAEPKPVARVEPKPEPKSEPGRVAAIPPAERPKPAVVTELPPVRPEPPASILPPQRALTAIRAPVAPTVAAVTPSGPAMRWIVGPNATQPLKRREARLATNGIGGADDDLVADPDQPMPPLAALSFAPGEKSAPAPSGTTAVPAAIKPIETPLANATARPEGRRFEANRAEQPARTEPAKTESARAEPAIVKPEAVAKPAPRAEPVTRAEVARHTGWVIQLAAMDDEAKAKELLSAAAKTGRAALASAAPFTERVEKGGSVLYRARFSGFGDDEDAQAACKALKRAGFSCFAQRI